MPTCPGWTVSRLVAHLARVQSWVVNALADPTGRQVEADRPPRDWEELLPWWDERREEMLTGLADPETPAWLPFTRYPQVARSWARRQAHEAAIHRLDAEHALTAEPPLVFDPEFAADGVDELIAWMVPTRRDWSKSAHSGVAVLHATDVDRAWAVRLSSGMPPEITAEVVAGDVTIAGPADAVYRRVWGRPSSAVVTGSTELLEPLAAP
ncbi:maleylpyruvate isomerase family mycothiol-dependent enzyme [Amycolatopsis sacchari]|uniref:maleylpyruvate isomerase family mycothiol-dependent enzyme n=1 Tax=Amycolatopsis sacchari TaxID=115433 RepID=UPI003D7262BF